MQKIFNQGISIILIFLLTILFVPCVSFADTDDDEETVTYSIDSGETVEFDEEDFNDVCENMIDDGLNYVKFTLPSSSRGTLYYNDTDEDDYTSEVSSSKKYYYDDSPSLSDVTFVPDEDYSGTLTIEYNGYGIDGDSYSGEIEIEVSDPADEDEDNGDTAEQITYSMDSGKTLDFDGGDFNDVCDDLNGEDLDYIKFTLPSSSCGTLYYDYEDENDYSSEVTASKKYYYDESPYLSKVSFVPEDNASGVFTVNYTAYDTEGESYTGSVEVTVSGDSLTADSISYTESENTAVYLKDSDFNNVCLELTGNQLSYVKFALPSSSNGILYYGYNSDGSYTSKVNTSSKYYYTDTPYLLNVAYVPSDDVTGTATISYTGYDTDGFSFSGKLNITIGNDTATSTTDSAVSGTSYSKYFSDIDESYSWATAYIDKLYESGIVAGTETSDSTRIFNPSYNITRGDFMLILYRAFNLQPATATNSFSDVSSDSYYYSAVTAAKSLNIAQGTDNCFYPDATITREDAMVLVQRALTVADKSVAASDTSNLSSFNDGSQISDYAKSAVAALVKSGIISGSYNQIHPKDNLTRAEVASIIYKIK